MPLAIVLIVYGVITVVGGVAGFVTAKSRASLIAGTISGAMLIASGALILANYAWGAWLGFAMTVLMMVMFGMRYAKTKAVMPAGMMLGISVVVFGILFTQLLQ